MRIFQSKRQVTVSIRLNTFGELFSAGEALSVPECHLEDVARESFKQKPQYDSLPEAQLWHPGGACPAQNRGEEHDGDGGDRGIDQPDGDSNCGRHRSRISSVHWWSLLPRESLLKAKGRLLPFIRNFEQKLIYISLIE